MSLKDIQIIKKTFIVNIFVFANKFKIMQPKKLFDSYISCR